MQLDQKSAAGCHEENDNSDFTFIIGALCETGSTLLQCLGRGSYTHYTRHRRKPFPVAVSGSGIHVAQP